MKTILSFLLVIGIFSPAIACLNFYIINEEGQEHFFEDSPPEVVLSSEASILNNLKRIEHALKSGDLGSRRHEYISDYAALLMQLGRQDAALTILQKLVKNYPEEYNILGNLAVAYELNGALDSAYFYLQAALKINPSAHHNSEWFHLRILEAAIGIREGTFDIKTSSILRLENLDSVQLGEQIAHQINERSPLTIAPNPFYAKVLEECADYYKRVVSVDWAIGLYTMSLGYHSDAESSKRIWTKIKFTREKVLTFEAAGRSSPRLKASRKELASTKWETILEKQIAYWATRQHNKHDLEILDL